MDDLLAVASVAEPTDQRWLGGVWSGGLPPGPAFTQDPCEGGTDRVKVGPGEIATPQSNRFVVYMPAGCSPQFIGPKLDAFIDRLKYAFTVYEGAAVERVLVDGDGHAGLGPYLGDANMQVLSPNAVDPVAALRLLETAIAKHGSGLIHASPSTVVSWDAMNLTVIRELLTFTKRGTPIAVGAGYINARPDGAAALTADHQWAFASGPIEIIRGAEIDIPASTYEQALERSRNDVEVLAERPYAFNWIGRQDPNDDDHVQAGVLVNENLGDCLVDGGSSVGCVVDGGAA